MDLTSAAGSGELHQHFVMLKEHVQLALLGNITWTAAKYSVRCIRQRKRSLTMHFGKGAVCLLPKHRLERFLYISSGFECMLWVAYLETVRLQHTLATCSHHHACFAISLLCFTSVPPKQDHQSLHMCKLCSEPDLCAGQTPANVGQRLMQQPSGKVSACGVSITSWVSEEGLVIAFQLRRTALWAASLSK